MCCEAHESGGGKVVSRRTTGFLANSLVKAGGEAARARNDVRMRIEHRPSRCRVDSGDDRRDVIRVEEKQS